MNNIVYIKGSHIIDRIDIKNKKIYPSKEWMRKYVEFWWMEKLYGISYLVITDD